MNPIIYIGYGFTLNNLDENKLTDAEKDAFEMITDVELMTDINGQPIIDGEPIEAYYVDSADSVFVYFPDVAQIGQKKPIKAYTFDEADKMLIDYTTHMFDKVVDKTPLTEINQYFDKEYTRDEIKKILHRVINKIDIQNIAQEQSYVDFD